MIVNNYKKYGVLLLMLGMVLGMMAQGDEREFYVFDASNGMAANSAQTIKCTKTGRMVITTIGHVVWPKLFKIIIIMRFKLYLYRIQVELEYFPE